MVAIKLLDIVKMSHKKLPQIKNPENFIGYKIGKLEVIGFDRLEWFDSIGRREKKLKNYINGLDRVDSSKGYIKDNVVTCCENCNRAKLDLTQQEFFAMIKSIYENHNLSTK